ncbi:hypothetical protein [Urbifossiella limnaea]|uniref:hypothetical protein n=1 Tax=Urbifossiella limnaea TaxID=2528023 RepID=UPI00192E5CDE|nr:hypothetical protein [Urbifossiella limnaea]
MTTADAGRPTYTPSAGTAPPNTSRSVAAGSPPPAKSSPEVQPEPCGHHLRPRET